MLYTPPSKEKIAAMNEAVVSFIAWMIFAIVLFILPAIVSWLLSAFEGDKSYGYASKDNFKRSISVSIILKLILILIVCLFGRFYFGYENIRDIIFLAGASIIFDLALIWGEHIRRRKDELYAQRSTGEPSNRDAYRSPQYHKTLSSFEQLEPEKRIAYLKKIFKDFDSHFRP